MPVTRKTSPRRAKRKTSPKRVKRKTSPRKRKTSPKRVKRKTSPRKRKTSPKRVKRKTSPRRKGTKKRRMNNYYDDDEPDYDAMDRADAAAADEEEAYRELEKARSESDPNPYKIKMLEKKAEELSEEESNLRRQVDYGKTKRRVVYL